MKLGIIGLPNVGKSTLFNAITKAGAECANYPFCTIEPNVGVVSVPDERLDVLAKIYAPNKITPATVEFIDIAGLVKGASQGEGLGNKFLTNIREVDAIVHVVRCFSDDNIVHVEGNVQPLRDVEIINLELAFADLDTVDKRMAKVKKTLKNGDKATHELKFLEKIKSMLEQGRAVRGEIFDADEHVLLSEISLLTVKPVIYVANVAESDYVSGGNEYVSELAAFCQKENAEFIVISAKIEEEIAILDDDEKKMFLDDIGVQEPGLDRLIKAGYCALGLISYLTAGTPEVRAWSIKRGTRAPQAAGKIHSDFERGFIRAEVVAFDDLANAGSINAAKEKGLVRSEGKEYVVEDGDVILFRFNV